MNDGETPKKEQGDYPVLLMKTGYIPALLILLCSALLFVAGSYKSALCVSAGLALTLLVRWAVEKAQCDKLGITREKLLLAELRAFEGDDGLRLPRLLRAMPAVTAAAAGLIALLAGIVSHAPAATVVSNLALCLISGAAAGFAPMAAAGIAAGVTELRQNNIELTEPGKLGEICLCDTLVADKSLFYGGKGAEIREFCINGEFDKISNLRFALHLPMILSFYVCDDGSLGEVCGLRGSIGDSLLRIMRATPEEQKVLSRCHVLERRPYTEETGFVFAGYSAGDGVLSCAAGDPDRIMERCTEIYDNGRVRELYESDRRRINVLLRRAYQNGRRAAAAAAGDPEKGGMTLIGLVFLTTPLSTESAVAVSELARNGIKTIQVSDMNEESAFAQARSTGVAWDISQVMTGARIDNFREASIRKALPTLRLAAEVEQRHRTTLMDELSATGRRMIAASRDPADNILAPSAVRITSSAGGPHGCDGTVRQCKTSDVAAMVSISKKTCSAIRRAICSSLAFPAAAALFLAIFTAASAGTALSAPAVVTVSMLLPLLQGFSTAASGGYPRSPGLPGGGYLVWSAALPVYAAIAAVITCDSAGQCAAFLTLSYILLASGLISRVWGNSLFRSDSYGGRGILVTTVAAAAAVTVLTRIAAFNSFMDFAALPYDAYPAVIAFALMPVIVYEAGRAARARRTEEPNGN